jgi:hypothetical protein
MSSGKAALVIGLLIGKMLVGLSIILSLLCSFSYLFALPAVLSACICLLDSPFRGLDKETTKSLTLVLGLRYY